MFGCCKQPGIAYRSLKDILGDGEDDCSESGAMVGMFVQVTMLEIYNEEIYDLLSSNGGGGGGLGFGWPKGNDSNSKIQALLKKTEVGFKKGEETRKAVILEEELVLRDNKLTKIPDVSIFKKLLVFDVSYNEITSLHGLSKVSSNLKELYVSKNEVTQIEEIDHTTSTNS